MVEKERERGGGRKREKVSSRWPSFGRRSLASSHHTKVPKWRQMSRKEGVGEREREGGGRGALSIPRVVHTVTEWLEPISNGRKLMEGRE